MDHKAVRLEGDEFIGRYFKPKSSPEAPRYGLCTDETLRRVRVFG